MVKNFIGTPKPTALLDYKFHNALGAFFPCFEKDFALIVTTSGTVKIFNCNETRSWTTEVIGSLGGKGVDWLYSSLVMCEEGEFALIADRLGGMIRIDFHIQTDML